MLLILYVFASFGVAFALGYSKISLPLRERLDIIGTTPIDWSQFKTPNEVPRDRVISIAEKILEVGLRFPARWLLALLECPACLAFWLGAASTLMPIPFYFPYDFHPVFHALFLGFGNMGAVLSLGLWTGLISINAE